MIYLLNVQGKDKIGLVEGLADVIKESQGNWLESRLCRLGGQFAGIVRVEFESAPKSLPKAMDTLTCNWHLVDADDASVADSSGRATIAILAADRVGIVKQITSILAAAGANVEEIESRVRCAPFSGERMFEARCVVSLTPQSDRRALRSQLESLAEELMCDIDFDEDAELVTV